MYFLKKYNEHSKLGSSTMALAFGFLQYIRERRSELIMWLIIFLWFFHFWKKTFILTGTSLNLWFYQRKLENVPLEMISLHCWAETFFGKRSFWKESRLLFIMSGMHLAHKMRGPFLPVQSTVHSGGLYIFSFSLIKFQVNWT